MVMLLIVLKSVLFFITGTILILGQRSLSLAIFLKVRCYCTPTARNYTVQTFHEPVRFFIEKSVHIKKGMVTANHCIYDF